MDERWSDSVWAAYGRSTYAYDSEGRRLSALLELWENGQWEVSERQATTYLAGPNELYLTSVDERWASGQMLSGDSSAWTYDSSGHQTTFLTTLWENGKWVNNSLDTYTPNANGYDLLDLLQGWSNGEWVNENVTSYSYDAKGREVGNVVKQWLDNAWVNEDSSAIAYDTNGNTLTYRDDGWADSQWVPYWLETWAYPPGKNFPSSYLDQVWTNGLITSMDSVVDTYDANGELASTRDVEWSDSGWIPGFESIGVFDGGGNDYGFDGSEIIFIRTDIVTGIKTPRNTMPATYSLSQNYPNPFNPTTTIHYELPKASFVRLSVFNILGQEIRTLVGANEQPGTKSVRFDGSGLPSGVYFYRLVAGSYIDVKKMMLLK